MDKINPHTPKKCTHRLSVLDIPEGLQEVVSQKQEDREKQKNRNNDPKDTNGSHCNHSTDLRRKKKTGEIPATEVEM